MKTKIIIIFVALLLVAASVYYYYWSKPKAEFTSVDYVAKTCNYKVSVGSYSFTGTKAITDNKLTTLTNGDYTFTIESRATDFLIHISKKGVVLRSIKADLVSKQINIPYVM